MLLNSPDEVYNELLNHVLKRGKPKQDRTGVGTLSWFGWQSRYNLRTGFPLLTTKRIHIPSVIHELLWFVSGGTNIKYLHRHGVTIWDEWADESGDIGESYGKQWRKYGYNDGEPIDQLGDAIKLIKNDPTSRRIVVSAWNPYDLKNAMANDLPPCHILFQFYVERDELSCHLYQRSADVFLGVPFNIASYAALTHMVAHVTGLKVGDFIHSLGDVHLYTNHIDQAREQLSREPKEAPTLDFVLPPDNIDGFMIGNFRFKGYNPHPKIEAEVAV